MSNSIVDPKDPDYCEQCGGECTCGAKAAESKPTTGMYFVTCRMAFDDEDSGYLVEAENERDAIDKAQAELLEESGLPPRGDDYEPKEGDLDFYVNHVVYCGPPGTPSVILHVPNT